MSISIDTLKEAISIKEQIASLESRLHKILGGGAVPSPFSAPVKTTKGRRKMSAAARAKISAAQKTRWAKAKGTAAPAITPAVAKPAKKSKRKLSPEGRARIVAALKKRWAAKKK